MVETEISDISLSAAPNPSAILVLDDCKGEIYTLYVHQKQSLKAVMKVMESRHGLFLP